jgi:hypothetical protein
MDTFTENESYKHKMAKEVLKEWFYGGHWKSGKSYRTNLGYICPNRKCGVWFEYPIVNNKDYDSVHYNWDEILKNPKITEDMSDEEKEILQDEYVPTYNECIAVGIFPKRVIDVVLTHKGVPLWFIEICHTNPTSQTKINELKMLGVTNLIEIDAEWIMKQTEKPVELKYKRLI